MIKKLTEKLEQQKQETVKFDFKEKYEGIAGSCPDCGSIVTYDCIFHRYVCLNPECGFEANICRERIIHKRLKNQIPVTNEQI